MEKGAQQLHVQYEHLQGHETLLSIQLQNGDLATTAQNIPHVFCDCLKQEYVDSNLIKNIPTLVFLQFLGCMGGSY